MAQKRLSDLGHMEFRLAKYGLSIDSMNPGDGRTYAIENLNGGYRYSDRMEMKQLKAWYQGYIVGKEGRPDPRI